MIVYGNGEAKEMVPYRAIRNGKDLQMIYRNNNIVWNNFVQKVGYWDYIAGPQSVNTNTDNTRYSQPGYFSIEFYMYNPEMDDFQYEISTPLTFYQDSSIGQEIPKQLQSEGRGYVSTRANTLHLYNIVFANGVMGNNIPLVNFVNGYIFPTVSGLNCTFANGVQRNIDVSTFDVSIHYKFPNYVNSFSCNGQTWYDLTNRFQNFDGISYDYVSASLVDGMPVGNRVHYTGNLDFGNKGLRYSPQFHIFRYPTVSGIGDLDLSGVYGNKIVGLGLINGCAFLENVYLSDNIEQITPGETNNQYTFILGCSRFNGKVIWGNNLKVLNNCWFIKSCSNYNRNFIEGLPATCTDFSGIDYCPNFNQPVNFYGTNVVNLEHGINGCTKFNQEVDFRNISRINNAGISYCYNFNSKVMAMNLRYSENMFAGCNRYNYPVNFNTEIGSYAADRSYPFMFNYCINFNQPIRILKSLVLNAKSFLAYCYNFNQPVNMKLGRDADISGMFQYDYNFNQPVNMGLDNGSNFNTAYMFYGCSKWNSTLTIRNEINNASFMFYNCANIREIPVKNLSAAEFVQPNTYYMYYACHNLGYNTSSPIGVMDFGGFNFNERAKRIGTFRDCINVFYYLNHIRVRTSMHGALTNQYSHANNVVSTITGMNSGQWSNSGNCNVIMAIYNSTHFRMNLYISANGASKTGLPQGWHNKYVSFLNDVSAYHTRHILY